MDERTRGDLPRHHRGGVVGRHPLDDRHKGRSVVDDRLDIARTLLDRLLVDLKGEPLGRIDDVELEADDQDGPPRVTALLCGPLALGPRLGHKWGDVWAAIGRRLRDRGSDEPVRIPWALVTEIGAGEVRLGITAAEAPTLDLEHWTREHITALIPGNGEG